MSDSDRISIVFDVDGTLIDSDGFDVACFVEAVREVLGNVVLQDDWRLYRHATDAGILSQILEENGLASSPALVAEVRDAFGVRVKKYLEAGGACEAVLGAREAVARLREQGMRVGVATGGWSHTAWMKLDRAGIPCDGLPLASSDDSLDRVKIMGESLRRLGGDPGRAIYVGNGDWDRRATLEAGWAFIGIGPLLKGRCGTWVADFLDPAWPDAPENALRLSRRS